MGKKSRAKQQRRQQRENGVRPEVLVAKPVAPPAAPNRPINISDASFQREVVESELPVLVDFWASWCGPCKMIAPVLEGLAEELQGQVKIVKLNTERNRGVMEMLNVRSLPTLVLFKDGEVVDVQIGAVPKPRLEAWLKKRIAPKRSALDRLLGRKAPVATAAS